MEASPKKSTFAPVDSPADAEALAGLLQETMLRLSTVIGRETELTKAGKIHQAMELQGEKARLAEIYMKSTERYRANADYIRSALPNDSSRLREFHEKFRVLVDLNLAALGTAKALSESLIHQIVEMVNEHHRSAGYTSNGAAPSAAGKPPPLKFNRSL